MANVIKITSKQGEVSKDLYQLFLEEMGELGADEVALVYFTGKREGLNEWCPDCIPAAEAFEDVAQGYDGLIKLYSVYVGSRVDWASTECIGDVCTLERSNAFMSNLPKIMAVPSVGLYVGQEEGIARFFGWHPLPDSHEVADYKTGFNLEIDVAEHHYALIHADN